MGCAAFESLAVREEKNGRAVPVIIASFASKQLRPGGTWKVYLKASDPDGDMKRIICLIEQKGIGPYPLSYVDIKEENRRELSGYLYWTTGGISGAIFTEVQLTVQIQDMARHLSGPVSFPLKFQEDIQQEDPPKEIFQEKDLGPIMIRMQPLSGGGLSLKASEDGGFSRCEYS
jgi:hypothetical protein